MRATIEQKVRLLESCLKMHEQNGRNQIQEIESLERQVSDLKAALKVTKADREKWFKESLESQSLEKQIAILRGGLGFYADEKQWELHITDYGSERSLADEDDGEKAREVLAAADRLKGE